MVPKTTAIVPGAVNVKDYALHKDHENLTKFLSEEDDDYRTVSGEIADMMGQISQTITTREEVVEPALAQTMQKTVQEDTAEDRIT
jgi:NTP pyrophosphatase (non-canonical NTP hydrolase)